MLNVHKSDLTYLVRRLKAYPDKEGMVDLMNDCNCSYATVKNYIRALRPDIWVLRPKRIK